MKIKINEYKPEKILSKTVLNFADYVINPYRGCQLGCLYCYVKTFKAIQKKIAQGFAYGTFVDIKINSYDLLKKELEINKPRSVVLGASTEIYQPVEKKYKLTRNILKLLNKYNVKIYLLTKSDLIIRDIDILKSSDVTVFFTVNSTDNRVFNVFENNSALYDKRINTLKTLKINNIKTILHIGPVLPNITDYESIVTDTFDYIYKYEFENLNLFSVDKNIFLKIIQDNFCELFDYYQTLFNSAHVYYDYWAQLKSKVVGLLNNKKKYEFFFHNVDEYFNNKLNLSI